MSIHLKLELISKEEITDWQLVKTFLGNKSNTEALRSLIRRTAIEAKRTKALSTSSKEVTSNEECIS